MRRFIAFFSLCIFIFIHFLSFQPVSAVSSVDYGEMLNIYLGAAETALAASQGVTIDWSNVDLPPVSDTWTDQEKAQYIVQYVGNLKKVGQHAIYEWLFGEGNNTQDIISAETAAIGLSHNSNINTQDIKAQLDNILATNSQNHVFQTYSDKVIARWNEYNTNYINNYIDNMNPSTDGPELPVVPENIETALHNINSFQFPPTSNSGTFWQYGSLPMYDSNMDFYGAGYSYVGNISNDNVGSFTQPYVSGNNVSVPGFACIPISNIYITSENGVYSYTFSFTSDDFIPNVFYYNNQYSKVGGMSYYPENFYNPNMRNTCYMGLDYASRYSYTRSASGTLLEVLNNISYHFRAVNIYIDGVLTSLAYGNNISSGITFNVPDAVIDSGIDDGKIVAHPIYYPDTMNTDKALNIDLDKVVDAIASRIAQGDTDITFDDLVDAGAAVKLDGTTLTDADTIVKDVSVPISRARVETIDGVIPTIDVIPPVPPLPPMDPGDYSGEGFSGMSVLARIINATVQGLPTPIILTFFGVVFGAVILGIIKILHH